MNQKTLIIGAFFTALLLVAIYIKPAFFGYYGFSAEQCVLMFASESPSSESADITARVCFDNWR